MPSFLNLNQQEAAAAVPAGEIAVPDETVPPVSTPPSPTTSAPSSSRSNKEHRRLFLPMPTTTTNNTANGGGWPTLGTSIPHRAIALFAFTFLAVVLCSVTVRHLAAATSSKTASDQSLPLPMAQPVHQVPSPPLADQLDALRSSMAQLQNAVAQLQQQKSEPVAEAQIWAPPNYLAEQRMPLARRQMAWQPMKRMAWQPMKRMTWQPMKRMIQWQPVKRNSPAGMESAGGGGGGENIDPREQLILAIEQQLVEVLKAGEGLGISAEQILAHLRARNGDGGPFYG